MPARKKSAKKPKGVTQEQKVAEISFANIKLRKSRIIILVVLVSLGLLILTYGLSKWAVLAWVDGKPITRVEYYKKIEESNAGKDIKDQMIIEKLIFSEAEKKGVQATQVEINKEFEGVKQQIGTESMKLQLSQVGMSEDDFRKQLNIRILIRKLFSNGVFVSDKDLDKYITDQKALFGENEQAPKVTDGEKAKIKQDLMLQKIQENFSKWVSQVQNSSRVIRN